MRRLGHRRDPDDHAELLVFLVRLEQLIDAGHDSIDVVFDGITRPLRIDDRKEPEMTELSDKTGAPVTITLEEGSPIGAYRVQLADGTLAGRAAFMDNPEADGERIFFHTEVGPELSGRGLGGLLVREALADSVRRDLTVVPVCPLFAAHLEDHGAEFSADGGRSRRPNPADIALVKSALASDA